jgi:hypothetical protein
MFNNRRHQQTNYQHPCSQEETGKEGRQFLHGDKPGKFIFPARERLCRMSRIPDSQFFVTLVVLCSINAASSKTWIGGHGWALEGEIRLLF